MPTYEICYTNDDGSLACTFAAMCRDDLHAKVLAHAMKPGAHNRFEVWLDRKLVYERPQYFGEAAIVADDQRIPRESPVSSSPTQQPLA